MALTDKLTAIANAIRAKTGKTESLTLEQMPTEIESITTGGEGEKPFDCHSVTFMYGDTVLYVRSVGDGDTCADPVSRNLIQAPTKESDAQYDYTFYGWGASDGGAADSTILQNITEDKTVYAIFSKTLRTYTITFYDEDGTTVLATKQFAYGTIPSYTPTKDGVVFSGWTTDLVPVTGDASYVVVWGTELDSGTWDENNQSGGWILTTDYTLRIYGTGTMLGGSTGLNVNWNGSPWYNHRTNIKKVIVEEGITYTSKYAFYGCSALESVTLPGSLVCPYSYTFDRCTSLKSVVLPDSVKYIGDSAFNSCSALESINIPEGVVTIGASAFQSCEALKSINLPAGLTTLGKSAFSYCENLECEITIPSGITSMAAMVFNGCYKLPKVNIRDGIRSIGNQTFADCKALESIELPSSLTLIDYKAFLGCAALAGITIPANVTKISRAFSGCTALASATFENTEGWWVNTSSSATSGDAVDVSNPATAAALLNSTYAEYDWNRSA